MSTLISPSTLPKTLVMKFGGTSVGSAEAISQVADITRQARLDWPRIVVVVSAMSGVTDILLQSALEASKGDTQYFHQAAQTLSTRHTGTAGLLVNDPSRRAALIVEIDSLITEFTNLCQAIAILGEASPRALDTVASTGERLSVRLVAAGLESAGLSSKFVEATQCIVSDARFQDAHPDLEATTPRTRQVLGPMLDQGTIPVVTGFIAATPEGITTTLGRGGSDYSAALLGAALPANEVWIWTDVDGVMSADPRLVPEAKTIPELSYREIAELAYFGAKVVHPKTIRPVIDKGIPLRICNTFNANHPGTRLVAESSVLTNGVIKSVTAIPGLKLITVEGRGMLGVPGVAARTFSTVAGIGVSVPLISQASSEQSICFAVPAEAGDKVVHALESAFAQEIHREDIDRVWTTHQVVIVTVVGAGMRSTPGVAGRIFSALGNKGVNVIAIAQGSSEVSISLVADEADTQMAVRILHELIEL